MNTTNTQKGNLDSPQKTNASWLVIRTKAILDMPPKKPEKPIFLLSRTHEAEVRKRKILKTLNGDLGVAIASQKDFPVKYGLELRDTAALE